MKKSEKKLWDGIDEKDFLVDENTDSIVDEDVGQFDLEEMTIFSANINYFRQLLRLSDSLKPVERRILYSMYLMGAKPNSKNKKCGEIIGYTMKYHGHGDASTYSTLVNMAQSWKKPVPYIDGKGNYGNEAAPDSYGAYRYTEALLSKYAYECFFEDYDPDCIETIHNTAIDGPEPSSLPSKFPNVLVNGGMGIAVGNAFRIIPYHIDDIVALCKRLIKDPDHPDIYINPSSPTGCDIIDIDGSLRRICDTGEGTLRMRADIEVLDGGKNWILKVNNIPWLSSLTSTNGASINAALVELSKAGVLPIKEIVDDSYPIYTKTGVQTIIDYKIIIDKAHDPYIIRQKILKNTELEKTVSVNFKLVLVGLSLKTLTMRDLVLSWLDERREYKRRLLNKKIVKIGERIALLNILIYLLEKNNIEKTIKIIRSSDSSEIVERLIEFGNMNSFQAGKISGMPLHAFTKDAKDKYETERSKLEKELDHIMTLINSEKKIDEIISEELDALKKYSTMKKSPIKTDEGNVEISDTDHLLVVTKQNLIKKLPVTNNMTSGGNLGSFKQSDYPILAGFYNNRDDVVVFDSLGRFSSIPVHTIDNTESSKHGNPIFKSTKLEGSIVSLFNLPTEAITPSIESLNMGDLCIVVLTKSGILKRTKTSDINKSSFRNSRIIKIRDNDFVVDAKALLDTLIIVYTKRGKYTFIDLSKMTPQGTNASGLGVISLDDGDECIGFSVVGKKDTHLYIVSEKGYVKKCELQYMDMNGKRKAASSYLATVSHEDGIYRVIAVEDDTALTVTTQKKVFAYESEEVPLMGRKAKGSKLVPIPLGERIIGVNNISRFNR